MKPLLAVLAVLAFDAPAQAATSDDPAKALGTIAVLPVTGQDVGFDELIWLQTVVRDEVVRLGVDVQPADETIGHLASARQLGVSCGRATTECMAKVGAIAGVSKVVASGATAREDGTVMDLRLVDVESGREERRVVRLLNGDDEERRARVFDAATRLVFPARARGEIVVEVDVEGAEVIVDGVSRGYAPLPGGFDVAAGEHVVEVRASGYEKYVANVVAPAAESTPVLAKLTPLPKSMTTMSDERRTRVDPYGLVGGMGLTLVGGGFACLSLVPGIGFAVTSGQLSRAARVYALAEHGDEREKAQAQRQLKSVDLSPQVVAFTFGGHRVFNLLLWPSFATIGVGLAAAIGGAAWTASSAFTPVEE